MENVTKVNFKELSKPTDQKAMRAYHKKYPNNEKAPCSREFLASAIRFRRAMSASSNVKFSSTHDLRANVDYWKKHGKLPENTDMNKIKGKGMYGAPNKRRR